MTRPTRTRLAALVLSVSMLSGCGAVDSLVGFQDPPVERTDVAALDVAGAEIAASRALQLAEAAQAEKGKGADAAIKEAFTGAALAMAQAARATRSALPQTPAEPLTKPTTGKAVAISRGKDWPRAILATHLDEVADIQFLHVLVSTGATKPYQVSASVPMLAGASLPSLGPLEQGVPVVSSKDRSGVPLSPDDALAAYAAALGQPKGKPSKAVSTKDLFAQALATAAKDQVKGLGRLGTYSQRHQVVPGKAIAWRLPDGSRVVFGLLQRTDSIKAKQAAKELVLTPEITALTGKKKAKSSIVLTSLEHLVMVIPVKGPASVIAVDEQIKSVAVK